MDLESLNAEQLTVPIVAAYLDEHPIPTANWFGPTGQPELSAWIDRDETGWRVWDTDERASVVENSVLQTDSESEALIAFLRRAAHFQESRASTVRHV